MKPIDIPITIQKIAEQKAATAFTKDYIREDNLAEKQNEGLGMAIAGWAEWEGLKIMRVFKAALEDANYQECATDVQEWIHKLESID
jgi:Fe-S cluster assembly ATPase SufC